MSITLNRYFDRAGNPLTLDEWVRNFGPARGEDGQPNPSRHVAREEVNDGQGREHLVSTVWLGLNHAYDGGPPLIFETMVFCHHDGDCPWNEWQDRYSTEEQAAAGHTLVVEAVKHGELITEERRRR